MCTKPTIFCEALSNEVTNKKKEEIFYDFSKISSSPLKNKTQSFFQGNYLFQNAVNSIFKKTEI